MNALSKFLPDTYDPAKPVAVIAGKARYPILLVDAMRKAKVPVRLIAFAGETEGSLIDSFAPDERSIIKVGQLGHMLKSLKKLGAGYAIMAGQITPRRLFKGLHPDLKAVAILTGLKERNAATIFGAIAREIESIGIHQLDARVFLDASVAERGVMTGGKAKIPDDVLRHGIHIAKACARLDIGQGVVVSRGTVLAVEAFEGTDAMLERAGDFGAKDPVFIKTVKPAQDYRFDVPVFGERTLRKMIAANIRYAALEADRTLILEKPQVLAQARKAGIQILGYS
jgi:DUF1009 family protein